MVILFNLDVRNDPGNASSLRYSSASYNSFLNITKQHAYEYYFNSFVPKASSHNIRCVELQESGNCLSVRVPSYGP